MNTTINDFLRSPFCHSQPSFVQEICSNLQALLLVCQLAVPEFTMELFKPGIFEAAATLQVNGIGYTNISLNCLKYCG